MAGSGKQGNGWYRHSMLGRPLTFVSALAAGFLVSGCATIAPDGPNASSDVTFVGPVEFASIPELTFDYGYKYGSLAKIDPLDIPSDGSANQTLSLFGREDIIADISKDYRPTSCVPLSRSIGLWSSIEEQARQTSIVIVNESHERSEHRGFTAELASRLRLLGYDTLALEALSNPPANIPTDYQPLFLKQPTLPYFDDADGHYLSEAGFGRLGRLAKKLGYQLLAYEALNDPKTYALPRIEQITRREEEQARNIAAFLERNPRAKLIVHVGYSHAGEVPMPDGTKWMAARLKEMSGIDPLTISQTTCRGGSATIQAAMLPVSEPRGRFDLIVDHPTARFQGHRPEWRKRAGDQLVPVAVALLPRKGWRVIEARPVGEPNTSVPMDRVAIRPGEAAALMLPPGRYTLRAVDVEAGQETGVPAP